MNDAGGRWDRKSALRGRGEATAGAGHFNGSYIRLVSRRSHGWSTMIRLDNPHRVARWSVAQASRAGIKCGLADLSWTEEALGVLLLGVHGTEPTAAQSAAIAAATAMAVA